MLSWRRTQNGRDTETPKHRKVILRGGLLGDINAAVSGEIAAPTTYIPACVDYTTQRKRSDGRHPAVLHGNVERPGRSTEILRREVTRAPPECSRACAVR